MWKWQGKKECKKECNKGKSKYYLNTAWLEGQLNPCKNESDNFTSIVGDEDDAADDDVWQQESVMHEQSTVKVCGGHNV